MDCYATAFLIVFSCDIEFVEPAKHTQNITSRNVVFNKSISTSYNTAF